MGHLTLQDIIAIAQLIGIVGGGFYFTGRVTAILSQLREITDDHEDRLRNLEGRKPRTHHN